MASDRQKGVILSYISVAVGIVLSLVYTPFLLDKLGQSEYGLYSLVNTVMSYLTILDFGLGNTIVRYTARYCQLGDKKKEYSLYGMFLSLYAIMGIIALIAGSLIAFNADTIFAKTFDPGQAGKSFVMIMIAVVNVALSFPLSISTCIIHGYEKYYFSNLVSLIQKILTPVTMIAILFAGQGSIGLLLGTAVLNTSFNLYRVWYAFKNLKVRICFSGFDLNVFKEIFAFSLLTFITVIADKLFWSIDQVILGIIGDGMADIASYGLASVLINAFITVTSVVGHMYLPRFTKMVTRGDSDEEISREFIRISRIQFYICMLIFGGFLVLGYRFITELYASPEYELAYYISILIMAALVVGISQNVSISVVYAKNMHKFRAYAQCIIAIVNVVFTVFAIYRYGAIGAAAVTVVSYVIGTTVLCFYYQMKVGLSVTKLWKQLIKIGYKYVILIAVFFVLNSFVGNKLSIIPYFLLFGAAFVILYFGITYFACMNEYEKGVVNNFARKIKKRVRV